MYSTYVFHSTILKSSQGAQGLLVLELVPRIFTETPNSFSTLLRQQKSRYLLHARPYLAAKAFRYLRTVIVTAVVYLALIEITYILLFSVSGTGQRSVHFSYITILHRPVFLLNSRYSPFLASSEQQHHSYLTLDHLLPKLRC